MRPISLRDDGDKLAVLELAEFLNWPNSLCLISVTPMENVNSCWNTEITPYLEQGILTEGEGLVQLTSPLRLLVF
jgi:hypothetical protein